MANRVRGKRSSAIVPRVVFATAAVAVVPACARNAGQGTAAQPAAIVARESGVDAIPPHLDAAAPGDVRVAVDASIDVMTGDAVSGAGTDRPVDARDAGATAAAATDAGAPVRRRRRETPVPVPTVPGDGRDRFRLYGVARSTFENDPRHMRGME